MKNMNRTSDADFFKNAKPEIFASGRKLRKQMTAAEIILWRELRGKKVNGLRFRRQHPVSRFVVDFYCHEKKLVIELDGEVHDSKEAKEKDESRTFALESLGLKVIRFRNEDVIDKLESVLEKIRVEYYDKAEDF
ncbi:MAG: endonuclease domain-containing protein [Bacteroidota bacterium]|nr:endonuclease domain-containing protein [Bacteroidota bacterium]